MWNIKIENTLEAIIKCLIGSAHNEIYNVEDKFEALVQMKRKQKYDTNVKREMMDSESINPIGRKLVSPKKIWNKIEQYSYM